MALASGSCIGLFSRLDNEWERMMQVETVKLSRIVMKLSPELVPFLKKNELDSEIVLVDGLEALEAEDVMEIVQYSITEHNRDAYLH